MTFSLELGKRFRDISVKRKLLLIVLVTISVVTVLMSVALCVREVISFKQEEETRCLTLARIISHDFAGEIVENNRAAVAKHLSFLAADPHIMSASVFLPNGEQFAAYRKFPHVGEMSVGGSRRWSLFADMKTVYPLVRGGERYGTVVIVCDGGELATRLATDLGLMSLALLVASILGGVVAFAMQRVITSPLAELARAMEAVGSSQDYSMRTEYDGGDEIGTLARGFNRMLGEIGLHKEQLHGYQERLAELIALRTEELLRVKEEAEAAAAERLLAGGEAWQSLPPPAGPRGDGSHLPRCSTERALYALMDCLDEEVFYCDGAGGLGLANRPAARALGVDLDTCLVREAHAEGFDIYSFDLRSLPAGNLPTFLDMQGAKLRRMEVVLLREESDPRYQLISSSPFHCESEGGRCVISVVRDITMEKEAEETLSLSSSRLLQAEESLRRSLAAELHDEVGRDLTAVHLNLHLLSASLDPVPGVELAERLNLLDELVEGASCKVAGIIRELRPPLLEDFGLKTALESLVDSLARLYEVDIELCVSENFPRLRYDKESAIFRIAQEALNNAFKHASANLVTVDLVAEGEMVRLTVEDDGAGFDPGARHEIGKRGSFGLAIMRERAIMVGGSFSIVSQPGGGTTVSVEIERE